MMNKGRSRGRRPGASTTREQILVAARASFARNGYDGASIRAVAASAGVDPALVHYFFETKDGLFAAAMQLPITPSEVLPPVIAEGLDGLGERIVRRFLAIWDDPANREPLLALVRSATSHEPTSATLRQFVEREVVGRLARAIEAPEPKRRATLVASQLMGLLIARYVLALGPLARADHDTVVAAVGPTLQRYLNGDLD